MTAQGALCVEDLVRLEPALLAWLRTRFPFVQGRLWLSTAGEDLLASLKLSRRQRTRAATALTQGMAFWDRIGLRVLVPICEEAVEGSGSQPLAVLVLSGVNREVGPEEALRWLPVLRWAVSDRFRILKGTALAAGPGEVPPFVRWALETLPRSSGRPGALMHLLVGGPRGGLSRGWRTASPEGLKALCEHVWPGSTPEWLGGSGREAWFLIWPAGGHLSPGLRGLIPAARRRGLSPLMAYGIPISPEKSADEHLAAIARVEAAARELHASVLCQSDLDAWEARLAISGVEDVLARVHGAVRGRGSWLVAYGVLPMETSTTDPGRSRPQGARSPNRPFPGALAAVLGPPVTAVAAGPRSGFLIRRLTSHSGGQAMVESWQEEIRSLCTELFGITPGLGVSASWQPRVGRTGVGLAALKAFSHSQLLGPGAMVTFDALTCNISGDELLAWGDLLGALREYRRGLSLDPTGANLRNSVGVCLAELGSHREAHQAFLRAVSLDPSDFMAHYNLAGARLRQQNLAEAEESLRHALGIRPSDCRVASRLAEVLIESGRPAEAAQVLEACTAEGDKAVPAAIWRLLGQAYQALGRWPSALEAWKQALKRNSGDAETLAYLALGYLEAAGDAETAVRLGRQAEAQAGSGGRILGLLNRLYKGLGDRDGMRRIRLLKHKTDIASRP